MITEEKTQVLEHFSKGRKLYKLMEFEQAKEHFAKALKVDPEVEASKVYYARCKLYIENPPPEDWDGVTTLESKL